MGLDICVEEPFVPTPEQVSQHYDPNADHISGLHTWSLRLEPHEALMRWSHMAIEHEVDVFDTLGHLGMTEEEYMATVTGYSSDFVRKDSAPLFVPTEGNHIDDFAHYDVYMIFFMADGTERRILDPGEKKMDIVLFTREVGYRRRS